ncbi:DUF3014 domain-containing protein [Shewanella sedimentimangrovi]|uniref:DUF3014 domain-containing protein n=1 Tax=Shewanella sedimentimangrovi TaxID=2814293 RepID=A0ABX7R160_9GAMM|nr:DUF3014 domain-containing protein [Shewanella sedimentimangrovi]QSX37042.1 DUF3014 domain-containing protein [Shewanella sedimentimangrovi]
MQVNQEDRISHTESQGSGNRLAIVVIVLLVAIGAGLYFYFSKPTSVPAEPQQQVEQAPEPQPPAQAEPEVEPAPEPVTTEIDEPEAAPEATQAPAEPEPLPALADSDALVQEQALLLAADKPLQPLLAQADLARQFVVFVDNLAQGELARKTSPVKGPEQTFSVSEITDKIYMNPDSFRRYDKYATLIAAMDQQQLLSSLKLLAPLFNEAFAELGYSDMSFESRLQQAFEQVLAAPVIEEPIELTSVSVNYRFADPKLEALPAVQKLMLRMGPENTRKIKAAIRKLQAELSR